MIAIVNTFDSNNTIIIINNKSIIIIMPNLLNSNIHVINIINKKNNYNYICVK